MADQTPIADHRLERILAVMVAAAIGLSIAAILAVVIATGVGVTEFSSGAWPAIIVLQAAGIISGAALMIALLVISGLRRGREAKDASN
ncbi:MAG: hypothetical protein ABL886_01775 [Rhodoglobus sp.]